MCQELLEVLIGLVAWSPPGTDETGDASVGGPGKLPINSCVVGGVVADGWQVGHSGERPVRQVIPHIVEGQYWAFFLWGWLFRPCRAWRCLRRAIVSRWNWSRID